jgi:tetratricopeptide (TPR) repeat protein
LLLSVALVLFARFRSKIIFAWWFPISAFAATGLVLVLHLVSISTPTDTADRFLYLPFAGLVPILARGVEIGLSRERKITVTLSVVFLVSSSLATARASAKWSDELRFWRNEYQKSGSWSFISNANLAESLLAEKRFTEALLYFQKCDYQLGPDVKAKGPASQINVAIVLTKLGKFSEAAKLYDSLLIQFPKHLNISLGLASVHMAKTDFALARAALVSLELKKNEQDKVKTILTRLNLSSFNLPRLAWSMQLHYQRELSSIPKLETIRLRFGFGWVFWPRAMPLICKRKKQRPFWS